MTEAECVTQLKTLHDAIVSLSSGSKVVRIRFADREVEYSAASLAQLQSVYRVYFRECGDAAGLPDLEPRRGRPLTGFLGR
jgi:hypothetical protein